MPSDLLLAPSSSTPSSSFPQPSSKRHRSPPKPPPLKPSSSATTTTSRYNSLVDSAFAAPSTSPVASSLIPRSPNPWSPSQPQEDLVDTVPWTLEEPEEDSEEELLRKSGGRRGLMRKMKSTTSLQVVVPPSFVRSRVLSSKLDASLRRARSTLGFHHHQHRLPTPEPTTNLFFDAYGSSSSSSINASSTTIVVDPPSSSSPPSTPRGSMSSRTSWEIVVEIGHRGGVLEGVKWGTRRGTSLEVREGRKCQEEEEEVGSRDVVHPAIDARW